MAKNRANGISEDDTAVGAYSSRLAARVESGDSWVTPSYMRSIYT